MEDLQEIGFDVAAVKVGRQREHHRLHHPQPGNGEADDVLFAFFLVGGFDFLRVIGCGGVAYLPDFQQNVGKADFAVVPDDAAAVRAVIEVDADDAVCTQKLLFDQPDAGGAGDAAEH
ncbi:Uncharacterised protein [Neisseria meningitidis]|nr:Uncharacterised protein [Neisseria meningitidis]CWO82866.1 Uncharacterised protein [Neisseria meningitidis]CWP18303.1 Uncharacterised protein [Neisseria meningitidis]CWP97237.1 Uncharacterised protein [Neisseria meningitidis]CWQ06471.1 Uncharacterised protein [Neisseria meningitidis]